MIDDVIKALMLVCYKISVFLFIFSLFKTRHLKNVHYRIVISGTILGLSVYYFRFIIESPMFTLTTVIFLIVLLTTLFNYSIIYSFLIGVTTFIIYAFLETLIVFPFLMLEFTTIEKISGSLDHYILFHSLMVLSLILLSILFKFKGWGFSFITKKYKNFKNLGNRNLFWSFILVIGIIVIQFLVYEFEKLAIHHILIIIIITILFLITIAYAYAENRKALKDRYGGTNLEKVKLGNRFRK